MTPSLLALHPDIYYIKKRPTLYSLENLQHLRFLALPHLTPLSILQKLYIMVSKKESHF